MPSPWADAKLACIHASHPSGSSSTRSPLQNGPSRANRLLRVLFRKVRSKTATPQPIYPHHRGYEASDDDRALNSSAAAAEQRRHIECGPRWPVALPGPLCGGESGSTGRAAGTDRTSVPFRAGRMPARKARPRLTDLPGMDSRQAPSGVAFLFGYLSLWPRKEKVTRAPKAHESTCSQKLQNSCK